MQRSARAPGGGRPLVAALLSVLVPGAGQLYLGRSRRGIAMLSVALVVLAGVLFAWRSAHGLLTGILARPSWLLALLALDVALLGFRVFCVVDAGRLGAEHPQVPGQAHRGLLAGMAALVLLTSIPHSVAAFYDVQAYDLLSSVFGDSGGGSAGGDGHPSRQAAVPGRFTVLLLGGDAGPDREGLRTDTMIVASVDPSNGRAVLFGLPRNMVRVPLPPGAAREVYGPVFPRPLNELYAFAEKERPDLSPGIRHPGIVAVRGAIEELLGIRIDHYALVDMRGFVDVIDALGGVTVDVTDPVRVEVDHLQNNGGTVVNLEPGRRHLSGLVALGYARRRKDSSDYDRMRRQRCLLSELAAQTDTARLLRAFPRLAPVIKRSVVTDMPLARVPVLLEAAGGKRARSTTIGFVPPAYITGYAAGYPIPDVARIQATVRRLLAPQQRPPTASTRAPTGSTRPPAGGTTPPTTRPAQGPDNCDESTRPPPA